MQMVFQHANCTPSKPSFVYAGEPFEQVDEFKYLGALMHTTGGLTPAIAYLHQAARRAMFGLYLRCQQLHVHDPALKLKLFDTLVRTVLSYCCEVWSIWDSKAALADLERVELGFLKSLLGAHTHTTTLHILAEFGRYPLRLSWMGQVAKYARRLRGNVLRQATEPNFPC